MSAIIWCRMFSFPVCYKNLNIKTPRIVIILVVLYGCETWSLILGEERRLRVFENMVLRKVFRFMWDVVTGEWKKMYNKEFNGLCCWTNVFRVIKWIRIEWEEHLQRVGRRGVYKFWLGNIRERVHLTFKNRASYI